MGTFRRRPLACFCLLFSAVGVLYAQSWLDSRLTALLMAAVGSAVAWLLLWERFFSRKKSPSRRYIAFLLAAVLAGLSWFGLTDMLRRPVRAYVAEAAGEPTVCAGIVLSVESEAVYASMYTVTLTLPSGGTADALLCMETNGGLMVGDSFSVRAVPTLLSEAEPAEYYRTYRAEGCLLLLTVPEEETCSVTAHRVYTARVRLRLVQEALAERLYAAIGGDEAGLVSALLLGERSRLPAAVLLDFRRTGAAHLLALSGFHLTLLVGLWDALWRFLRMPYLPRKLTGAALGVGYLLLTGAHASTLRATVMLLCWIAARLLGERGDSVTVLCGFLAVFLAIRPEAFYDAGLWLSLLAAFALTEVAPRLRLLRQPSDADGSLRKKLGWWLYEKTAGTLQTGFCVLLVTALPMWWVFGSLSVLSPLSTLLLTPLVTLTLGVGFFGAPVLFCLPDSGAAAGIAALLRHAAGWAEELTSRMAAWRGIETTSGTAVTAVFGTLLALLLATILLLNLKRRKPLRLIYPLLCWAVCFCLANQAVYWAGADEWTFGCATNEAGDSEIVCLCEQNGAVLVDFTDGSYTAYRTLLQDCLPEQVTEVRALCLTHYHKRHLTTLQRVADTCLVRSLWLPIPPNSGSEEDTAALQIARALAAQFSGTHTEVHFYDPQTGAELWDGCTLDTLRSLTLPRSTHPVLAAKLVCGSDRTALAWIGAAFWEAEGAAETLTALSDSRIVWLGNHGPVRKLPSEALPTWSNLRLVVLGEENALAYCRIPCKTAERIVYPLTRFYRLRE